jgi:hypothetical protein
MKSISLLLIVVTVCSFAHETKGIKRSIIWRLKCTDLRVIWDTAWLVDTPDFVSTTPLPKGNALEDMLESTPLLLLADSQPDDRTLTQPPTSLPAFTSPANKELDATHEISTMAVHQQVSQPSAVTHAPTIANDPTTIHFTVQQGSRVDSTLVQLADITSPTMKSDEPTVVVSKPLYVPLATQPLSSTTDVSDVAVLLLAALLTHPFLLGRAKTS